MYQGFKTRSEFESAPQMRPQSWGYLKADDIGRAVNALFTDYKIELVSSEAEAVEFYALNQMAAHLRQVYTLNEVLPESALVLYEAYLKVLAKQAQRLMAYLCLICTRESRHLHNHPEWWASNNVKYEVAGAIMGKFFSALPSASDAAAMKFRTSAPKVPMKDYTQAMCDMFNTPGVWSSNYGGKKWGAVTAPLRAFFHGEISAEMLVDTGYTLAHNGGPIFNKGMLYSHYDAASLTLVLDIQRGGMVADGIGGKNPHHLLVKLATPNLVQLIALFRQTFPGVLAEEVDFYRVQALGSVGTYVTLPEKPPVPKKTVFQGKPAVVTGKYSTGLGDHFDIVERIAA